MSEDMDLPKFFSKVMDIFATSMPTLRDEVVKLDQRIGERFERMERVMRMIQQELGEMRGTLMTIEARLRVIEENGESSFQ